MNWASRKLFVLLCVFFFSQIAYPSTRSDGTASLSGVLKGDFGSRMILHLVPVTENPVRYYDGYEAVSKADGSFSFTEIPPGQYRLTIDAAPELSQAPPGTSVSLHPGNDRVRQYSQGLTSIFPSDMPSGAIQLRSGEQRKEIVIAVTHKLSTCGHITHDIASRDQWGRDIGAPNIAPADTSVVYFRYNPEFGILDNETVVDTDKNGSFRVTDLAPGTYYLKVGIGLEIWFPGSTSFSMAKPIEVGNDSPKTCSTDILLPSNTGGWSAKTNISIEGGDKDQRYKAAFLERNAEGVSHFGLTATAYLDKVMGPDSSTSGVYAAAGAFEAVLYDEGHIGRNVWKDAPTQKVIFDSQLVTLKGVNETSAENSIVFKPHPKASIEGELRLENITRQKFCPYCQAIYVSILREGNGEFQTVTLSPANHFDFHNVTPGDYQLFVYTTRPDKVFLKSVIADGQPGQGRHFVVSGPKFVPMVVTLSGDLAQAAGHVSPDVRHAEHWETEGMRPRASVFGKVVGSDDSVYTVRLLPLVYNNSANEFTTKTASDGSFGFENVPPGVYQVRAHDKNYVRFDYGGLGPELRGKPIVLASGARVADILLHAPHYSSICGRVTNSEGDPQVSLRIWYRNAEREYDPPSMDIVTDSNGYFRIDGLRSGDYALDAPLQGITHLSSGGKLYDAKPVHVEEGTNPGCGANSPLEFRVPKASGQSFSISGLVDGELPTRVGDRFVVELQDVFAVENQSPLRKDDLAPDHHFHFDGIPPGRYRVTVYGFYGPKPVPSTSFHGEVVFGMGLESHPTVALQDLIVSDQNISDLKLQARLVPTVTGTSNLPDLNHSPGYNVSLKDVTLSLIPRNRNGTWPAPVKDNGNGRGEFSFRAVDAGNYALQVVNRNSIVNRFLYIQSLRVDGAIVNPANFSLPQKENTRLEVEFGTEMASLRAHVSDNADLSIPRAPFGEWCGRPSGNYDILLFPELFSAGVTNDEQTWVPRWEIGRTLGVACEGVKSWATQAYNGKLEYIPPGKYFAIALQSESQIDIGLQGQDRLTAKQRKLWLELAKIATPVTLHPGENLELSLSDKTVEAARLVNEIGMPDEQEDLHSSNGQTCCNR